MSDIDALQALLTDLRDLLLAHAKPGYLTLRSAARYLDIPPDTLREWVRTKGLVHYKAGKPLHFLRADLDAFMATHRRQHRIPTERRPRLTQVR